MQSALTAVTSLFIPSKTIQPAKEESSGNPHQMPAASTSTYNDMTDINRELNTYKDRLTQNRVEVECTKENLKTEYEHELRQQTLTYTRTIDSLEQQINKWGEQLHQ